MAEEPSVTSSALTRQPDRAKASAENLLLPKAGNATGHSNASLPHQLQGPLHRSSELATHLLVLAETVSGLSARELVNQCCPQVQASAPLPERQRQRGRDPLYLSILWNY
jgi:hypothetical protein